MLYMLVITFGTLNAPSDVVVSMYPTEAACSRAAADYLVGDKMHNSLMVVNGPPLYAKCNKVPVH